MTERLLPDEGRILAILIGFAPFLVLLLTWDPDGATSQFARGVREYALPVLVIEAIVVGVAFADGLAAWIKTMPRYILAALLCWLTVAMLTATMVAIRPDLSAFLTCVWVVHGLFAASVAFLVRQGKISASQLATAILAGFVAYGLAISF